MELTQAEYIIEEWCLSDGVSEPEIDMFRHLTWFACMPQALLPKMPYVRREALVKVVLYCAFQIGRAVGRQE